MNMRVLSKKISKYQKEVIKVVTEELANTPFYYEKQADNHLKIVIAGVHGPLFIGCTPPNKKSLKSFREEVKQTVDTISEPQYLTTLLDPVEKTNVEEKQHAILFASIMKSMRSTLQTSKDKEFELLMQHRCIDAAKDYRKSLVEKAVESLINHKNRVGYLKKSTKKQLQSEFNKHINFMLPTMDHYLAMLDDAETENITKNIETTDTLIAENTQEMQVLPAKSKHNHKQCPETVFNINALMSLSEYDRVDHLKSLTVNLATQLIENIQQAMLLNKDDQIAEVITLMQAKNITLDDIKEKLYKPAA